jgi:hypothetical protein
MKLKNILLFAVYAVLLSACAPTVAGLAQLPEEGSILVFTLVTALVTFLLLKLSEWTGQDLAGYANAIAAGIAPIFVTLIESYLNLIPPIFDNIVLTVIHLIVLLVGSIGTFFIFKRQAPSLR